MQSEQQTDFCSWCRGSGTEDTGGFTEYGKPIEGPCGACNGRGRVFVDPNRFDNLPSFDWGDPVDHTNRVISDKPILCPFTVVIDTREQAPWAFRGFRGDARQKFRPLVIQTVRAGLRSGDYSIQGCEHRISVERKSLADAFSTFTQERDRFERELLRLSDMDFAAVVIEGGWQDLIDGPSKPDKSELHSEVIGKAVYRSILAWSQRFPRIHWFPMPSRSQAEDTAFRLLERWWLDEEWKLKKGDW